MPIQRKGTTQNPPTALAAARRAMTVPSIIAPNKNITKIGFGTRILKQQSLPLAAPVANGTPAEETKQQKFERIAARRMDATLKQINLLANLASPNYQYTDEYVAKMEEALMGAVANTIKSLRARVAPAVKRGFDFGSGQC